MNGKSERRRGARFALAIALAIALAPPAIAEPPPAPDDSQDAAFSAHMQNGITLFQLKHYAPALVEFQAAYTAKPKASPLVNEALCLRELMRYPEAVAALEKALAETHEPLDDANQKAARQAIDEMRPLIGYLELDVTPPDAKVTLDGNEVPSTSFSNVEVSPNEHVIVAEHGGFDPTTTKITIASGEHRTATIALTAKLGRLHVLASKKDSPIDVDGSVKGTGEWSGELAVGDHTVLLAGEREPTHVTVVAGQETVLDRSHVEGPKTEPPKSTPVLPKAPTDTGPYVLVEGGGLYPTRLPQAYQTSNDLTLQQAANNFGALGGFRMGYRVNTFAAFEGLFDYSNVTGGRQKATGATTDPSQYSFSSWRLGPLLRLMSPGKIVKFVGSIGGGLAFHSIRFQNIELDTACPIVSSTGTTNQCVDGWGVDFFASTDAGVEFAIGQVLLGASINFVVDSTKSTESYGDHNGVKNIAPPYGNESLVLLGPLIRFGYAFW